jgi:hypothetical protein
MSYSRLNGILIIIITKSRHPHSPNAQIPTPPFSRRNKSSHNAPSTRPDTYNLMTCRNAIITICNTQLPTPHSPYLYHHRLITFHCLSSLRPATYHNNDQQYHIPTLQQSPPLPSIHSNGQSPFTKTPCCIRPRLW